MSKKIILTIFIIIILVSVGIAFYLFTEKKALDQEPEIPVDTINTNIKTKEEILNELNSFTPPTNPKTKQQILKELETFKAPTNTKTKQQILDELNNAPRPGVQ